MSFRSLSNHGINGISCRSCCTPRFAHTSSCMHTFPCLHIMLTSPLSYTSSHATSACDQPLLAVYCILIITKLLLLHVIPYAGARHQRSAGCCGAAPVSAGRVWNSVMGARAADAGHHIVHCVCRAVVDGQQARASLLLQARCHIQGCTAGLLHGLSQDQFWQCKQQ